MRALCPLFFACRDAGKAVHAATRLAFYPDASSPLGVPPDVMGSRYSAIRTSWNMDSRSFVQRSKITGSTESPAISA